MSCNLRVIHSTEGLDVPWYHHLFLLTAPSPTRDTSQSIPRHHLLDIFIDAICINLFHSLGLLLFSLAAAWAICFYGLANRHLLVLLWRRCGLLNFTPSYSKARGPCLQPLCITSGLYFLLIYGLPWNKSGKIFIKLDLQSQDIHSSPVRECSKENFIQAQLIKNESRNRGKPQDITERGGNLNLLTSKWIKNQLWTSVSSESLFICNWLSWWTRARVHRALLPKRQK